MFSFAPLSVAVHTCGSSALTCRSVMHDSMHPAPLPDRPTTAGLGEVGHPVSAACSHIIPVCSTCWPPTSSREDGSIVPFFPEMQHCFCGRAIPRMASVHGLERRSRSRSLEWRLPQAQQGKLNTAGLDVSTRETRVRRSWKDFAWKCEVCKKLQAARKCACDSCGTPRLDVSSRKTRVTRSCKDFAWVKCARSCKLHVNAHVTVAGLHAACTSPRRTTTWKGSSVIS